METAAQQWLDRLRSFSISDKEREEFAKWYQVPANQQAFDQAKKEAEELDAMIGAIADRPAIRSLRQQVLERTAQSENTFQEAESTARSWSFVRRWKAWSMAGGFAVAAAVFMLAVIIPQQRNTHTTEVGEQRVVMLDDGTRMTLDTNTRLRVDFERDLRHVRIERGQAYFEVANNPRRPFSVVSDHGIVTAVGTAFSVYTSADDLLVTLTEGKVQVATPTENVDNETPAKSRRSIGKIISLAPGEQLSYHTENGTEKKAVDNINEHMSWVTGKLVFKSAELEQVVASLNRYTDQTIRISDSDLLATKVDAVFGVKDTKTSILALRKMFDLDAFYNSDGSVELRRKKSPQG